MLSRSLITMVNDIKVLNVPVRSRFCCAAMQSIFLDFPVIFSLPRAPRITLTAVTSGGHFTPAGIRDDLRSAWRMYNYFAILNRNLRKSPK